MFVELCQTVSQIQLLAQMTTQSFKEAGCLTGVEAQYLVGFVSLFVLLCSVFCFVFLVTLLQRCEILRLGGFAHFV